MDKIDNQHSRWYLPLIFFGFSYLLFIKTFGHAWTYDDFPVIVYNPDILSLKNFFADTYPGRPMRELSYLLDVTLFGLNPGKFQIQSIFWHGLNGLLICQLLRKLKAPLFFAITGGLLFISHPLTVEVVANASHRKDSLALTFALISILCYHNFASRDLRKPVWLILAAVSYLLAYHSKQHTIGLPLVWAALELHILPVNRRIIARKPLVWLAGLIGGIIVTCWWFINSGGMKHFLNSSRLLFKKFNYIGQPSILEHYSMVIKSMVISVSKVLWPTQLAPEYTFSVPQSILSPWILIGLAIIIAYGYLLITLFRKKSVLFAPMALTVIVWIPVSNVWPLSYLIADRYLYAPTCGIILALTLFASQTKPQLPRHYLLAPLIVLLCLYSALTWNQIDVWANEDSLWSHTHKVNPQAVVPLNNLTVYANNAGDYAKAVEHGEKAVALNRRHPMAHRNLAIAYEGMGNSEKAIEYFRKAYAIISEKESAFCREIKRHLYMRYRVSP